VSANEGENAENSMGRKNEKRKRERRRRNLLCDKVAGINIQLANFFSAFPANKFSPPFFEFSRQFFMQFALVKFSFSFENNCKN
jgi:hypothetical protein